MDEGLRPHDLDARVDTTLKQREQPHSRKRSLPLRIVLDAAAVGVVAFFAWRERHLFSGFTSAMSGLTWYWVVLSFVAELASIPPLAEAQLIVLRAGGTNVDRRQMN